MYSKYFEVDLKCQLKKFGLSKLHGFYYTLAKILLNVIKSGGFRDPIDKFQDDK